MAESTHASNVTRDELSHVPWMRSCCLRNGWKILGASWTGTLGLAALLFFAVSCRPPLSGLKKDQRERTSAGASPSAEREPQPPGGQTAPAPALSADDSDGQPEDAVSIEKGGPCSSGDSAGDQACSRPYAPLCSMVEAQAGREADAHCRRLLALDAHIDAGWPQDSAERQSAIRAVEKDLASLCEELACPPRESNVLEVGSGENGLASAARLLRARLELSQADLSFGSGDQRAQVALGWLQPLLPRGDALGDRARLEAARAHLASGNAGEALELLRSLVRLHSNHAETQGALGVAYLATGHVSQSVAPLSRALELEPTVAERHVALGTARLLLGDLVPAERNFRAALLHAQSDVVRARAHGDLGALLLLLGRAAEGKAHLMRAAALSPGSATYLASWSYAELLLERPLAAEQRARRALECDPELVSGWLNLGLALVAQRRLEEARKSFERAAELAPSDPRPRNNLADLNELSADD